MAKRLALCIGINDYPYDGNQLNGCVNDAEEWAGLLTGHFGFVAADVTLLTDRTATKRNIVAGLKAMLAGAAAGDALVFTNSSHGSYVAAEDGESYEEVLCPYDVEDNHITDGELRELFGGLKRGVRLTAVIDSCFYGTATRAAFIDMGPGMRTPDDRRMRFLSPALRGLSLLNWAPRRKAARKPDAQAVFLKAGSEQEYAYEAFIEGKYHGVLTHYASKCIREAGRRLTYTQLASSLNSSVSDYPQHPQLEATPANKKRPVFT